MSADIFSLFRHNLNEDKECSWASQKKMQSVKFLAPFEFQKCTGCLLCKQFAKSQLQFKCLLSGSFDFQVILIFEVVFILQVVYILEVAFFL